jgi:hypothetical protein
MRAQTFAAATLALVTLLATASCSGPDAAPAASAKTPPPFPELMRAICDANAAGGATPLPGAAQPRVTCLRVHEGELARLDCGEGEPQTFRVSGGTSLVVGCGGADGSSHRIYYLDVVTPP